MNSYNPAPFVIATAIAMSGCAWFTSPSARWHQTLPTWSPYLVLQPDAAALGGYDQALGSLASRGAVSGVRIGLYADGRSSQTVHLAASFGLEVLGVIDDADLGRPDVAQVFDEYAARYPDVHVFQAGNEITTRADAARMTLDQYLPALAAMYAHVRAHYPNMTLVSQAEFGSGTIGARELAVMATRLDSLGLSPDHLVIAINVYSEMALSAYAGVLNTTFQNYRIWVTETGVADPAQHISYVETTYPQLRLLLRADRIYWYALWAGDSGEDSGYSLISNPMRPPIGMGPLFQRLTE